MAPAYNDSHLDPYCRFDIVVMKGILLICPDSPIALLIQSYVEQNWDYGGLLYISKKGIPQPLL
jgi:hypothetical protein